MKCNENKQTNCDVKTTENDRTNHTTNQMASDIFVLTHSNSSSSKPKMERERKIMKMKMKKKRRNEVLTANVSWKRTRKTIESWKKKTENFFFLISHLLPDDEVHGEEQVKNNKLHTRKIHVDEIENEIKQKKNYSCSSGLKKHRHFVTTERRTAAMQHHIVRQTNEWHENGKRREKWRWKSWNSQSFRCNWIRICNASTFLILVRFVACLVFIVLNIKRFSRSTFFACLGIDKWEWNCRNENCKKTKDDCNGQQQNQTMNISF